MYTFATFSRISRDTINSYKAVLIGLPVISDVIDVTIVLLLSTGDVILPVRLCGIR